MAEVSTTQPLVATIRERCRVCYTCVRECPAKAIRIVGGQAEVLTERCIGCGNCVRVCSQGAKRVLESIAPVRELLAGQRRVAACVAPSFPAEFEGVDHRVVVGMIRRLGFDVVTEVAFGADVVAAEYKRQFDAGNEPRRIGTACPAVVAYVERYHPDLVPALAPVVSPMVAAALAVRLFNGDDLRVVFIGPCIAKKAEAETVDGIDAVLTFAELRRMLDEARIGPDPETTDDFDPPRAGYGALFPVTGGMLQAAAIEEDLLRGDAVSADGRTSFVEAIREFESGDLDARLLEVLCCDGCVMGPGMTTHAPLFGRRSRVSRYVRQTRTTFDEAAWNEALGRCADLNLSRTFRVNDQRAVPPDEKAIREILVHMGKREPLDELNCGACGYDTCREHAIAIHRGFAESEMCLPYTIEQLRVVVDELAASNRELARVQEALVHTEKLASMGQLAAGIAHELNNPLGVVLMYSHLLLDRCADGAGEATDIRTIAEHADRCRKIVSGLLDFARQSRVVLEPTDLREIVERCVANTAFPAGVAVGVDCDGSPVIAEVDRDQMSQVLANLVSNAIAAMPAGGSLAIRLAGHDGYVRLAVTDTGVGVPPENRRKIFEPFFTTKQIGRGTGLGLAVAYGIVKMHRGEITIESNADRAAGPTGSTFVVTLPRASGQVRHE